MHYAHSAGHELATHLQEVARLAAEFAEAAPAQSSSASWAGLAGKWHDLGKYRPGFQRYLALAKDDNAHIEGRVSGREKTHSIAGALWALQTLEKLNSAGFNFAPQYFGSISRIGEDQLKV